jgi:hypothetical protein
MPRLVLHCTADASEDPCGICGQPTLALAGTQLFLVDTSNPVCPDCGRKHAPALAALVTLADAAERVGRIGRHSIFPPYTALLELARAAEHYTATSTARKAG